MRTSLPSVQNSRSAVKALCRAADDSSFDAHIATQQTEFKSAVSLCAEQSTSPQQMPEKSSDLAVLNLGT